ncbi:hypothetical protein GQ55_3G057500 [Panicum hallii var. hallii]|uniref:Late embryogenesis abundant protein LEA-2 subgroup domain-containing protein n=1 Tax=Panicum hallii var. hallii TaxID=1504633 RepID=A0A2T7E653_9POAL|nr:hypothetical protein GQ55_3G057500 [Panicum hallii var. hallii]
MIHMSEGASTNRFFHFAAKGDDDGEHYTSCLAIVRYAMAAAVTLLAIAVIALVIHAVLRSEDVRLSVNNGFIGADNLWERTAVPNVGSGNENQPISISKAVEPAIGSSADPGDDLEPASAWQAEHEPTISPYIGGLPKECLLGCPGEDHHRPAQVTLKKAKATSLRVILIAKNPGGRTRIVCDHITVSLFDVQAPYGLIGRLELDNFTVQPQTTITLQKRLKDANAGYIWDNYPGAYRFSVMVQVNASVTSFPLKKTQRTVLQSYKCQPVTVGLMDEELIYATDQVDCRP